LIAEALPVTKQSFSSPSCPGARAHLNQLFIAIPERMARMDFWTGTQEATESTSEPFRFGICLSDE